MCIFPKFYTYNTTDPERYAFQGNAKDGFDSPDLIMCSLKIWKKESSSWTSLASKQTSFFFIHTDRWGFSKMTKEQDIFYLSYAARRLPTSKISGGPWQMNTI